MEFITLSRKEYDSRIQNAHQRGQNDYFEFVTKVINGEIEVDISKVSEGNEKEAALYTKIAALLASSNAYDLSPKE